VKKEDVEFNKLEYTIPTMPELVEEGEYHYQRRGHADKKSRKGSTSSGTTMRGKSAKMRGGGYGYPKTHIGDNLEKLTEKVSSPSEKNFRHQFKDNLTEIQNNKTHDSIHGEKEAGDKFFMLA
jgi:hypothetical protein